MLLQGPLQNIWQLMQDFGLTVDAETQKLIDFALEAGLIGENFRPATDKMVTALEKFIDKLDQVLARFAEIAGFEWPDAPEAPSLPGGGDPGRDYPESPFPGGRPTVPGLPTEPGGGREPAGIDLNALSATSATAGRVVTIIELDGEVLARSNTRNTPGVRRLLGVA